MLLVRILVLSAWMVCTAGFGKAPVRGTASLPTEGQFAFSVELGGFVPTVEWDVEAKVTKLLPDGFEYEAQWIEPSDYDHEPLIGKTGKVLYRLPLKATVDIKVGEVVNVVYGKESGECGELGIAVIRDDIMIFSSHRKFSPRPFGVRLFTDRNQTNNLLKIMADNSTEVEVGTTELGTTYQTAATVETADSKEVLKADEIGKKSVVVKVDTRQYHAFVLESSRIELSEKGKQTYKCKPGVFQSVVWEKK